MLRDLGRHVTAPQALLAAATLAEQPKAQWDHTEVLIAETRTGRVVRRGLPLAGQPRFSTGINRIPSWSVPVKLGTAELSNADLDGLTEGCRFSWVIAQGSHIWEAGPVLNESYTDSYTTTISGTGLWGLLSNHRILANPARASLAGVAALDADVCFGLGATSSIGSAIPVANRNLSLHTIAKRIVQTIETAAGGDLPVVYPDDIAGTSVREYPGYDLASPGQRLLDLTGVEQGPEIEFRPEFTDETAKQAIQWRMRIGNPRLGTLTFPYRWDLGKALVSVGYSRDSTNKATRAFAPGNGMNRDMPIGYYDQPINVLDPGDMLLEQVDENHRSATDLVTLSTWAQALVNANRSPIPTLVATVRIPGDDGSGRQTVSPAASTLFAGDNAVLQLKNHARLADGAYGVRITGFETGDRQQLVKLLVQWIGMVSPL
jgi:hypothetical protein